MNIYVSVGWCRKNVKISLILLLFRAGERKNPFLIAEKQVRPSVLPGKMYEVSGWAV
jgi:hypothetical protein